MRNDGGRVCMVAAAEVVRVCSGTDNLSRNFAVTRLSSIPPSLLPCKTTEHHADRLQADVSFANSCAPRQTRGALAMGLAGVRQLLQISTGRVCVCLRTNAASINWFHI